VNRPLRRVSIAIAFLFFALLANASWVMVGDARHLDHRTDNPRPLFERLTTHRGDIRLQDGTVIAQSDHATPTSTTYVRSYPQKSLYATVTGWAGAASTSGVEEAEDDVLSGSDDRLSLHNFADTLSGKEKQGGYVVVTIDAAAQKAATQALQTAIGNSGFRGAVVAIDVHTGAIKALVGLPTYDPDPIAGNDVAADEKAYTALNAKKVNPLLDTATQTRYPPGSMFKLVTSTAALSTGRWNPTTLLDAPPAYTPPLTTQAIHNFAGESCGSGKVTFASALATSCNTAFAKLGVAVGQAALQQAATGYGIGDTPKVTGLPDSALSASQFLDPSIPVLDPPRLAQTSIGQFNVALTPLQAAMIVQAIANGGQLLQPYLVDSVHAPDGSVLSGGQTGVTPIGSPLSTTVDQQLTQMMLGVTTGDGTASGVFTSLGYPVAGKTGTAQHSSSTESLPPHTWFAGFGPANASATTPEYAVAAFVEDGGTAGSNGQGATVAAPIVRDVLAALTAKQPAASSAASTPASTPTSPTAAAPNTSVVAPKTRAATSKPAAARTSVAASTTPTTGTTSTGTAPTSAAASAP
jgi:peptidoglycan glycosyltransferase